MNNRYFLSLAIEEAKKSRDKDRYYVGAIIVKGGKIISKEYGDESRDGGHAEELAIKNSKEDVSGAIIYITMEPCSFRPSGKTSCSDLIINSGIKKVVYGIRDPQINIRCEGIERLINAGIEVIHLKELEERCKKITPSIFE